MPKEKFPSDDNPERYIAFITDDKELKAWEQMLHKQGFSEKEIAAILSNLNDVYYENSGTLDQEVDNVLADIEKGVKTVPSAMRDELRSRIKEELRRRRRERGSSGSA